MEVDPIEKKQITYKLLSNFFQDLSKKIEKEELTNEQLHESSKFFLNFYFHKKTKNPEDFIGLAMYISHMMDDRQPKLLDENDLKKSKMEKYGCTFLY